MPKYLVINDKIDVTDLTEDQLEDLVNRLEDAVDGALAAEVVTED